MKLKSFAFSFALLLLSSIAVFSQEIYDSSLSRNGYIYHYVITYKTLKDTPSWNPEKKDAPVSLRQAVEIGRNNLSRFVPEADDKWDLLGVKLHRIGWDKNKWIYEVEFYCFDKACKAGSSGFKIYVKLDGTMFEPKVEPENKQK